MVILYINNEHCTSVAQLKGYFSEHLSLGYDTYADLLDYGRSGDLAEWLRGMDEPEMASAIEFIDTGLSDHEYYSRMKSALTGTPHTPDPKLRPPFDRCLAFEGASCDVRDNEAEVSVSLRVLQSVNEVYELMVTCNWDTLTESVNPYSYSEGKTESFGFTFRKCPGKDIGEILVKTEGRVLHRFRSNADVDIAVRKRSESNLDVDIAVGDVKFRMIHVEGGTFTMGGSKEQDYHKGDDPFWRGASDDEKPAHRVTLSSYSIGETAVTQELWETVMGSNSSFFRGAELPVERVSWNDCQKFIRKLNKKTGRKFRLPTEAEWEYAARGGNRSKGFRYSGSNNIDDVAWYDQYSSGKSHFVKGKKPNELGIYDMSGNVFEWCEDWYGDYTPGDQTDPTGPANGTERVRRGGSWVSAIWACRLSFRGCFPPNAMYHYLGFRLVLSE